MPGSPEEAVYRFLDTSGTGAGTKNAASDYTAGEEFYYTAPKAVDIHRMVIYISDTAGATQAEYGNLGSALTNGYNIVVKDAAAATVKDLTDGVPIKTNADLGRYCYDVRLQSWATSPVNESVISRWTFAKAGYPLCLPIGYSLSITFNDNLAGLLEHYFMIQGYEK